MENNMQYKISPQVIEALKPIIHDMTKVHAFQQAHAGDLSCKTPDWVAGAKRCCCHVIFDSRNVPKLAIAKRADGKLWCTACNRIINTTFDKSVVQKILDCIEVVNQALVFGLINNLDAKTAQSIVSVKAVLPDIAQMLTELNQKLENNHKASSVTGALGSEYKMEFAERYNQGDGFTTMRSY